MTDASVTAFQSAITVRSADIYADFFLPHLRPDMLVLDCGCGSATITLGLAGAVHAGRVVGVDREPDGFARARAYAASNGCNNLALAVADGGVLPFPDATFDAALCHSVLEAARVPTSIVAELRRVTKRGGVVGAASVDYGGLLLGGRGMNSLRRFYEIRQQLWRAARIAEPDMGRRLRGLFEAAGFSRVEAFADYISYGTRERIAAFARDKITECNDPELVSLVTRHAIASGEELARLAASWEEWGNDPAAFFAFAWGRVLAWA